MSDDLPDSQSAPSIQLVEEVLRVGTRTVETGKVRVRTVVDEEPVVVSTILSGNYVTVDRITIGRVVDAVPPPREVDGVMIISVVEERLRVVRELILVEEVHMRDVHTSDPVEQTVTRRVMRAVIERESSTGENK
ncbi:MAG: YsnF/AvaK domain-containing protein [Janthinobacterium lividum]